MNNQTGHSSAGYFIVWDPNKKKKHYWVNYSSGEKLNPFENSFIVENDTFATELIHKSIQTYRPTRNKADPGERVEHRISVESPPVALQSVDALEIPPEYLRRGSMRTSDF